PGELIEVAAVEVRGEQEGPGEWLGADVDRPGERTLIENDAVEVAVQRVGRVGSRTAMAGLGHRSYLLILDRPGQRNNERDRTVAAWAGGLVGQPCLGRVNRLTGLSVGQDGSSFFDFPGGRCQGSQPPRSKSSSSRRRRSASKTGDGNASASCRASSAL